MAKVTRGGRRARHSVAYAAVGALIAGSAGAEVGSSYNLYGVSGLIDMPSASMQEDAEFATSMSRMGPTTRTAITFQITPRLQGSFRYSGVKGLEIGGFGPNETYYDRAFDLRFRLIDESTWIPAVTLGMQDFVGTGLQSAEYLVASKTIAEDFRVTAGLGWGRLGSHGAIATLGSRPTGYKETGGTPNTDRWFRGDVAPFGGVEWQATDKLALKMEYASDAYAQEVSKGLMEVKSHLNFGAEYEVIKGLKLGAYYLYGSELGVSAQIFLNPKRRAMAGVQGPAAAPVALRPSPKDNPAAWDQSWAASPRQAANGLRGNLAKRLKAEGIALESLAVSPTRVEVRVRNLRNDSQGQMIGRINRALTALMPASVETFDIIPVAEGMDLSRVRVSRTDIERLEHAPDNARALRERVSIGEAGTLMPDHVVGTPEEQRFKWSLGPYARVSLFDPDNPLRADLGLRLKSSYKITPGLFVSGSLTGTVVGNLDQASRMSDSVLPHVRSEDYRRSARTVTLESLTTAWYSHVGEDFYTRVTAGYLERSFAGVSGEVLWKPVESRLAFGAEVNYVRQRAFDNILGLNDYGVWTGHVSGYYAFDNGFHAQVDVGRYLAGDYGATFSLDREFANGWRVGAFATLTDVSSEDFGEGSFDKGIRLTVPLNWLTGAPSTTKATAAIRPLQRDGGQRVVVDGRLYETVRESHKNKIDDQWGRVWR